MAKMYAKERKIDVKLTVVQIEGWQRDMYLFDTDQTWINPSPNMRSLRGGRALSGHRRDGVHEYLGRPRNRIRRSKCWARRGSTSAIWPTR